MSRVAKKPIVIPAGVTITQSEKEFQVKGPKGTAVYLVHPDVTVQQADSVHNASEKCLMVSPNENDTSKETNALAGTVRANLANVITGVTVGFQKKLQLIGVGYRAQLQGQKIAFTLGFSHPEEYVLPNGISAEMPSQTEIVISGVDRQLVGQVAAEIRDIRPPESYKGKGVRYADERIVLKETKKK